MKKKWPVYLLCIAIPPAVGALSALVTSKNMDLFDTVVKPPLTPPGIVFPIAWSILYLMMGIALALVVTAPHSIPRSNGILFFAVQLAFNFFWSIFFFNLRAFVFSFVWLVFLWIWIALTACNFFRVKRAAGWLMIPYLLWVGFAGYLNLAIAILN